MNDGTMSLKEVMYSVLTEAGPSPSPRGLKKAFELMGYSAEDRAKFFLIYDEAKSNYEELIKDYIPINGVFIKFKTMLVYILIFTASLFLIPIFLYGILTAVVIIILLAIKYRDFRPCYESYFWKLAVKKFLIMILNEYAGISSNRRRVVL